METGQEAGKNAFAVTESPSCAHIHPLQLSGALKATSAFLSTAFHHRKLTAKGRHDAHMWAVSVGLVPGSGEAAEDGEPVAGAAPAGRDVHDSTKKG